MNNLGLILGMALVTYLPRLLPMVVLNGLEIGPRLNKFLETIPYTSLSILIVRGIITSDPSLRLATIAGIFIAGLVSYFKASLIVAVLLSILGSYLVIVLGI